MQSMKFVLLLFTVLSGVSMEDSLTSFVVSPDGKELEVSSYRVTMGSNLTLGCKSSNPGLMTIGKYAINGAKIFPIIENGALSDEMDRLVNRYSLYGKYTGWHVARFGTTYLHLKDVQPHDLGTYVCYSAEEKWTGVGRTNLTLLPTTDLFGVQMLTADHLVIVNSITMPTSYTCIVYRAVNSAADYELRFGKCRWENFDLALNTYKNMQCDEQLMSAATSKTSEIIFTDENLMPNSTFKETYWQTALVRDEFSFSLSADDILSDNWLNQTLTCSAYRSDSKVFSDFVTFVQPGFDWNFDQMTFQCGNYQVEANYNELVNFTCIVTHPVNRTVYFAWEISRITAEIAADQESITVYSDDDLESNGFKSMVNFTEMAKGLLVRDSKSSVTAPVRLQARASISILVLDATISQRYQLVAIFQGKVLGRSDFFFIELPVEIETTSDAETSTSALQETTKRWTKSQKNVSKAAINASDKSTSLNSFAAWLRILALLSTSLLLY